VTSTNTLGFVNLKYTLKKPPCWGIDGYSAKAHLYNSNIMEALVYIDIIEDHKVIRENLVRNFGFQNDFELNTIASSVEDYLVQKEASNKKADVILLDIGLPGISGLEAIPLLKEKYPAMDIIILTTYEEEHIIVKALCTGACSYISKKASLQEIGDAIRIVHAGGSYMSPSVAREIVTYLIGGRVSKATILTERQKEILQRMVDGKSYTVIAAELFISPETVKTHIKKLYQVLHVNSKSAAITMYLRGEID